MTSIVRGPGLFYGKCKQAGTSAGIMLMAMPFGGRCTTAVSRADSHYGLDSITGCQLNLLLDLLDPRRGSAVIRAAHRGLDCITGYEGGAIRKTPEAHEVDARGCSILACQARHA